MMSHRWNNMANIGWSINKIIYQWDNLRLYNQDWIEAQSSKDGSCSLKLNVLLSSMCFPFVHLRATISKDHVLLRSVHNGFFKGDKRWRPHILRRAWVAHKLEYDKLWGPIFQKTTCSIIGWVLKTIKSKCRWVVIVIDHTYGQAIVFLLELEALLHVLVIKGTKLTKFSLF